MTCAVVRLQDYKATQKVAADKEAQYLPKVPPATSSSQQSGGKGKGSTPAAAAADGGGSSEPDIESQALLQEQQLLETRAMENTIAFQEALIEERDHGIAGELGCCWSW